MEARPLMLRLYLEGREVPVISAVCTAGVNMGAAASIQVVPVDAIMDLLPRTLVHLFFYDGDEPSKEFRDKYKLLFVGELMGIEYVRSVSQRAAVLKCLDFSSYWDVARLLFYRTFNSDSTKPTPGATTQMMVASGAGTYKYNRTKQSPASILVGLLTNKAVRHPGVEGFMGGLLLMLEMLGGIYDGKGKENCRGLNDFFSQAEMRLHLSRTIGAARKDSSSATLLSSRHFKKWIRNAISEQSNTISFRDVLGLVLKRLSSYYASQLAPRFTTSVIVEVETTVTSAKKKDPGEAVAKRMQAVARLKREVDKALEFSNPDYADEATNMSATFGSEIPICSADGISIEQGQDPMQGLVRTHKQLGTELQIFALGSIGTYTGTNENGDAVAVSWGSPDALTGTKDFVAPASADSAAVTLAAGMAVSVPNTVVDSPVKLLFPGVTVNQLQKLKNQLDLAHKSYAKKAVTHTTKKFKVQETKLSKLYTHTFTPDQFLCPAPRCNVLFPEHISSISMSRTFSQEITRLHLTTRKEWEGKGIKPRYSRKTFVAPHVDVLFGKSAEKMMKNVEFFIFPHEVFSGVIPRFDQVPDMAAYEKLSKEKIANDAGGKDLSRTDYLVRMADFLFVKYRLAGRVVNISGRFNPSVAVGLAMLVLPKAPTATMAGELDIVHDAQEWRAMTTSDPEKYLKQLSVNVEKNVTNFKLPIQYAGVLHALQHTVNQEGGNTAYTISHTWIPSREEIPGMSSMDIKYRKGWKTIKTTKKVPLAGVLLKDTDVSSPEVFQLSTDEFAPTKSLEVASLGDWLLNGTKDTVAFLANRTAKYSKAMQVQVKVDQTKTKWLGPHGGYLVDAKFDDWETFTAEQRTDPATGERYSVATSGNATLTLTEKVGEYDHEAITMPFEYAVRPVWLAEVFSNLRIGREFYQDILGCPSICDGEQALAKTPGGEVSGGIAIRLLASVIDQLISNAVIQVEQEGIVIAPPEISQKVKMALQDIIGGITIQQASAGVARMYLKYSLFGHSGALSQFMAQYTRREFASLAQVLGDRDLLFSPAGALIAGEEGFHSRAYGDWKAFGLLEDKNKSLTMYGGAGELRKLDPKLDPRQARYWRVESYLMDLSEYGKFDT